MTLLGDRVRASNDIFYAPLDIEVLYGELGTVVDVWRVPVATVVWDRQPGSRCPTSFDSIDPVEPG